MSSRTSSRSTLTTVPSTMSPSLKYLMVSSIAARNASSDPMSLTATLGVEVACVLLVMSWWAPDADRNECCAPKSRCSERAGLAGSDRNHGTPRRSHNQAAPRGGQVAATRPHEDTAQSSGYVVLAGWSIEHGYSLATAARTLDSSLGTLKISVVFRET